MCIEDAGKPAGVVCNIRACYHDTTHAEVFGVNRCPRRAVITEANELGETFFLQNSVLVTGVGFSLLQQHFGFIKMPGSFIVQAYPVILSPVDILITAAGIAVIGYLIALMPVRLYGDLS